MIYLSQNVKAASSGSSITRIQYFFFLLTAQTLLEIQAMLQNL